MSTDLFLVQVLYKTRKDIRTLSGSEHKLELYKTNTLYTTSLLSMNRNHLNFFVYSRPLHLIFCLRRILETN